MRIYKIKLLGAKLGKNVRCYGKFSVIRPYYLDIGDNSTINEGVHFNCKDKIIIGKYVRISTNVQLHTSALIIDKIPREHTQAPIIIEDNVWIASGTIISAGVRIGKNSVIGANSVVLKNVEANSFYAGNPAKLIRKLNLNE